MRVKEILAGAAAMAALGGVAGCSGGETPAAKAGEPSAQSAAASITLTGAGSTFVNPAMSKWAYAYHEKNANITINYQSVGSGAGIGQYKEGTVDFGATDAPLSDADAAKMPTPTLNVPIISGSTVLAYNIPGLSGDLKLTPATVADIFLGKIKAWDDAKLKADNPDLKLPSTAIATCHRSDGSGTTYIFTDYLSAVSSAWKAGPGKGKTVNWPVGLGGKGNEGVSGLVKQTPGGIGYVELAYAVQNKMPFALLKNAAGKFVKATPESTAAAAEGFAEQLKKDIRTSIVNSPAPDAYPIAGFTYVLVSQKPAKPDQAKVLLDFLKWAMADGQPMAKELEYAPLAPAIVDLNTKALEGIQLSAK